MILVKNTSPERSDLKVLAAGYHDCVLNNIDGSGGDFLEIVSPSDNLGTVTYIQAFNATDAYICLYKGSAGNESLIGVIAGAMPYMFPAPIAANTRLSVKGLQTVDVDDGTFCLEFLGPQPGSN